MDIFGLAPHVAEDTLEYSLYPRDSSPSPAALRTLILEYVAELLPSGFLWHRDSFELNVQDSKHQNITRNNSRDLKDWYFDGRMRVGDCVDDEWVAVWLLKEISLKWDLAVSVHDTDGEFLLIEAADVLPAWITPENAEQRVWIYRGHLHIIPLSHVSDPSTRPVQELHEELGDHGGQSPEEYLDARDALGLIFDENTPTRAEESVEQAAWNRIAKYPAAFSQHIHRTKAYIPTDIARALSVNPILIQRAVEAFYTRDAVQLRAAQKMARFPPRPDTLTTVSMTRPAYAQLVGQSFHPPKVFGVWQEREGTPERGWRDVGMKIACGFEMMYAESKAQVKALSGNTAESREARMDALRRDEGYKAYVQGLVKAGYFGDEIAGSERYNEREQAAADKYIEFRSNVDTARPPFATQVEEAIKSSSELTISSQNLEEDSTEWLNIEESEFDGMLKQKFGRKDAKDQTGPDAEDRYAQEQANRLQELAKKVEGFVEGKGDLEGARFEDDILDDDDLVPDSDDESVVSEHTNERRQEAMDNLVPPLEPGDYGQMPASYSNSQPVKPSTLETETRIPEDTEMPALGDTTSESQPRKSSAEKTYKTPATTAGDSDQQSEQKSRERLLRKPILPRDRYDGVDSDDDTDPEDVESGIKNGLPDDSESDEDRPTVVGEVEIDMDEEQEEFIKFSREALGIDDELWSRILAERAERGAFMPRNQSGDQTKATTNVPTATDDNETHWFDAPPKQRAPRAPMAGPNPRANPKLDSFEAVMEAMEAELRRPKAAQPSALKDPTRDKGKARQVPNETKGKKVRIADDGEEDEEDIEAAMERELHAALDGNEDSDEDGQVSMDYNLIKNFLESFKGQAGTSGPVSNLAGRLQQGWMLPRDNEP